LPVPVWIALYGLSGFIALSLEILWFRMLGVMLKSTAFTFGTLLTIFLSGLALGTFLGIRQAPRDRHPMRSFLLLQTGVIVFCTGYHDCVCCTGWSHGVAGAVLGLFW
jgi:spermidine synthase